MGIRMLGRNHLAASAAAFLLTALMVLGLDVSAADGMVIRIGYDDHYCRHFAKHPSRWTLELADRYRERLGRQIGIEIDGKVEKRAPAARQTVTLPAGVGVHTVQIRSE